jgi:hypothetical protein
MDCQYRKEYLQGQVYQVKKLGSIVVAEFGNSTELVVGVG